MFKAYHLETRAHPWTPDAFVASTQQNCLYWKGGPNRWFTGSKIYKFDCDTRQQSLFIDLEEEDTNWKLYGCAIGVHPVTDEIYMALYQEFGTPTYLTHRYSPASKKIRDYDMIMNYWFPSLAIFPQSQKNGDSGIEEITTQNPSDFGTIYNLQGQPVKTDVEYGKWNCLTSGIYVWRSEE